MTEGHFSLRDEVEGVVIDALSGYYVQSEKATEAITGCQIHVFGDPLYARTHLLKHQGKAIPSPF